MILRSRLKWMDIHCVPNLQIRSASFSKPMLISLAPARTLIFERFPRRETESDEAWDRRIRSKYVDVCRFLLPAAALANVGMTANTRVIENMVRKMLSHELAEVREIGLKVKEVSKAETPTLVKYVRRRTLSR